MIENNQQIYYYIYSKKRKNIEIRKEYENIEAVYICSSYGIEVRHRDVNYGILRIISMIIIIIVHYIDLY